MIDHEIEPTELGSPQGGVISPLIANIYLDTFDQEMKRRGHRIVRYADDILILCASRSGAEHALEVATEILEETLKLTVNREKTHLVEASQGVKFLGVQIHMSWTRIQDKKIDAFKGKVKAITRRTSPVNLDQVIADLNPVLRGFANYFRMANCKELFRPIGMDTTPVTPETVIGLEATLPTPSPPAATGVPRSFPRYACVPGPTLAALTPASPCPTHGLPNWGCMTLPAWQPEFYPRSLELYFNRSRIRTRTYGSARGLNRE